MSATSKRRRRRTNPIPAAEGAATPAQPLTEWRWRTFPVFFALSAGLFIGLQLGVIVSSSNSTVSLVIFIAVAVVLGLGLSRLTTRFLIERRWIKPRPKRR